MMLHISAKQIIKIIKSCLKFNKIRCGLKFWTNSMECQMVKISLIIASHMLTIKYLAISEFLTILHAI